MVAGIRDNFQLGDYIVRILEEVEILEDFNLKMDIILLPSK